MYRLTLIDITAKFLRRTSYSDMSSHGDASISTNSLGLIIGHAESGMD